ncbi:hypothetical protein L6164_011986 [Bauhinia variegata]|uniref:Uncharacterized protein n=1 Tax=Bauhinia variegata TaxID=167791 RepID=A0ACB9P8F8_BAUVA|nr:hypothetical protein L6164_011986 [Bauhinia variegata]
MSAGSLREILAFLDDEDDDLIPVRSNNARVAGSGEFHNTGRGNQGIAGLKNTGYISGDGNGMFNRNHFGDIWNNNGYVNTGTQNIRGLVNNTGYVKGNYNGSIFYGGKPPKWM